VLTDSSDAPNTRNDVRERPYRAFDVAARRRSSSTNFAIRRRTAEKRDEVTALGRAPLTAHPTALASSHVYAMLTLSIGLCAIPLTVLLGPRADV